MAVLTESDRLRVWRGLMRYWSQLQEAVGCSKSQLRTTIDETDDWIDDNQSGYVSSLTHGGNFTAVQLTVIFCCVALMRVGVGLLRRVLGEVD